jgi:hypothetical protein
VALRFSIPGRGREREGPEELRVREREDLSLNPLLSFYSPLFYFWGNHVGGFTSEVPPSTHDPFI